MDYYDKLFGLATDAALSAVCLDIFKRRARNSADSNHAKIQEYLGRIWFSTEIEVSPEERELVRINKKQNRIQGTQANLFLQYKASMECLLSTADADLQGIVYKRYLKWLYKEKDFASCVRNALKMTESHPRDVYGYEWICKIYCENHDEPHNEVWQRELTAPIQTYAEKLLQFNANSNLALLIKAFDLYAQQQYIPARQLVLQAQQSHPSYKVTLQLLARIHMHLGAHRMALRLWQELGLETEEYAQCLSHETDATKLKKAVELLQQLPQNEENVKALAR